jgi:DNA-directed RNA polymerase subunit M/transcription elongation factor TFIIS
MLPFLFLGAVVLGIVVYVVNGRRLKLPADVGGSGAALACSSCGNFMTAQGAEGAIVRCETCGSYGKLAAGPALHAIDPSYVADRHVFTTFLPEAPKWPACCCLCGDPAAEPVAMAVTYKAEATMEDKLTTSAVVGLASLGTLKVTDQHVQVTERFNVPHCGQHRDGVQLLPAGIGFRSYGYFKQFVDANRATFGG